MNGAKILEMAGLVLALIVGVKIGQRLIS